MFRRAAANLLIVGLLLGLGFSSLGCGDNAVSGKKYVAAGGVMTVEFTKTTVTISDMNGTTGPFQYLVDGNKITVYNNKNGEDNLTIMPDGTLQGKTLTFVKTP